MPFNSSNNRLKNKKNISYVSSLPESSSSGGETIIFQQKPWNKSDGYDFDLNFRFDLSFKSGVLSPRFDTIRGYKTQNLSSKIAINEIPKEILYDFSSGISSDWAKQENFNLITVDGNDAAGNFNGNTINAELVPTTIADSGGYQIKSIEIVWQEDSSQTGFTFQFLDSSGSDLMLLGGDNPQWELEDADGSTSPYNGSGYNRWIRYTVVFNWNDGTYTYEMYDIQDGTLRTDTRNMFNNTNFYKFVLNDRNGSWGNADYMAITSVKITMY